MCDCEIDPIEVVFHRKDNRKARKEYICFECGGTIYKGFPHIVHRTVSNCSCEKSFAQTRTCICCEQDWESIHHIMSKHIPFHYRVSPVFGSLGDHIQEAFERGWVKQGSQIARRWKPIEQVDWSRSSSDQLVLSI